MNWITLIVAGMCECLFAFCLGKSKESVGASYWAWMTGFVVFTMLSMGLLTRATRTLPLSLAYPVWTGIGAVGTVLLGVYALGEAMSPWRLLFTATLIVSVIGLKMAS